MCHMFIVFWGIRGGGIDLEVAKQNHWKFLNLDQNFKAKPSVDFAQLQILRPNLALLMQDSIFIYLHTNLLCLTLVIHFVALYLLHKNVLVYFDVFFLAILFEAFLMNSLFFNRT